MRPERGKGHTYNSLNELTSYSEGALTYDHTAISGTATASQSLEYDALGNMTSVTTDGGTALTRAANAQNEYTSVSGATTPTYDNNGNMTTDSAGLKYSYDAWNRLIAVKNSAGTTTLETFEYDGLGRRIAVDVGGTTTKLYYSAAGQVLEESSGGDYTNRYVWSPVYVNALILRDSMVEVGPALRLWVIQDANWNVVALVNSSGSVVERYDYTPFGQATALNPDGTAWSGSAEYNWIYLFQGGRLDTVTGNYQFGARDYSPVLMRWTTNDPIWLAAGDANTYRTEGNSPVDELDPRGYQSAANNFGPFGPGRTTPLNIGGNGNQGGVAGGLNGNGFTSKPGANLLPPGSPANGLTTYGPGRVAFDSPSIIESAFNWVFSWIAPRLPSWFQSPVRESPSLDWFGRWASLVGQRTSTALLDKACKNAGTVEGGTVAGGSLRVPKKYAPFPGDPTSTSIWTKVPGVSPGLGQSLGRFFSALVIPQGFFDLGVIIRAGWDASQGKK
jgi:RHS repeat-associated protein